MDKDKEKPEKTNEKPDSINTEQTIEMEKK